jgi:hypothetical protein
MFDHEIREPAAIDQDNLLGDLPHKFLASLENCAVVIMTPLLA